MAAKVKATPYKFIVDIDPETDDRPDVGGTAKIRAAAGTRAEYAAAYRHIVDRFRARGVTNVLWAWTMSGWTASDPSKAWSLQQLWPGPNYVNVIMWDPYNHDPARWRSFSQIVAPFYNAIRGGLLDPVDANAKKLPLGLGEYGCVADSLVAGNPQPGPDLSRAGLARLLQQWQLGSPGRHGLDYRLRHGRQGRVAAHAGLTAHPHASHHHAA